MSQIYFWNMTLHVSDSISIIRSLALYTQHYVYVIQVMLTACYQALSITCMYCCVYSARLRMMDRDTVRNM